MGVLALAGGCGSPFAAAAVGAGGSSGGGGGGGGSSGGNDLSDASPDVVEAIACMSDKTCTPLGQLCDLALGLCADRLTQPDAGVPEVAPPDASQPANCAPPTGDPCHAIPRFTATQVVDGAGDEFCAIPAFVMSLENAGFVTPAGAKSATTRAVVRMGWSTEGLHAHVHVDDAKIFGASPLYNGDNVQFFIAGEKPAIGKFSGTQDGAANQLMLAPPEPPAMGRSSTLFPSATFQYVGRVVAGGYEVELKWPWNGIATPVTAGKTIGLDLVIGVKDLATSVTRDFEYGMLRKSNATTSCMGVAELWCDDMLWCSPTLR